MLTEEDLPDANSISKDLAKQTHDSPSVTRPQAGLENPPGDYSVEQCSTFNPLNRKVPQSYVTETRIIAEKRQKNVQNGKRINAGLPETQEEQDLLRKRFLNDETIDELADYFQRSKTSIELRLIKWVFCIRTQYLSKNNRSLIPHRVIWREGCSVLYPNAVNLK